MSTSSAVRPTCRSCGLPIHDPSWITWNGHSFHNDHLPNKEPAIDPNPALVKALEPFAELADEGNEDQPDDTKVIVQAGRSTCYGLTLADLRRARAAVHAAEQDDSK